MPEGGKSTIIVNRYERSNANRRACIAFHGTKCQICNFDFEKKYGVLGKDYIEVHHIVPVSKLGADFLINPIDSDSSLSKLSCYKFIQEYLHIL